jgi:hypothetical protein
MKLYPEGWSAGAVAHSSPSTCKPHSSMGNCNIMRMYHRMPSISSRQCSRQQAPAISFQNWCCVHNHSHISALPPQQWRLAARSPHTQSFPCYTRRSSTTLHGSHNWPLHALASQSAWRSPHDLRSPCAGDRGVSIHHKRERSFPSAAAPVSGYTAAACSRSQSIQAHTRLIATFASAHALRRVNVYRQACCCFILRHFFMQPLAATHGPQRA